MSIKANAVKNIEGFKAFLAANEYSITMEYSYLKWVNLFLRSIEKEDLGSITEEDCDEFVQHLRDENYTKSSIAIAVSSLNCFFDKYLNQPITRGHSKGVGNREHKPIEILTDDEVDSLFSVLNGVTLSISKLMLGTGIRIMEALRIRLGDIDLNNKLISIRDGRGAIIRRVGFPDSIKVNLTTQMKMTEGWFNEDRDNNRLGTVVPKHVKDGDEAGKLLQWQYLFSSKSLNHDVRTRTRRRTHVTNSNIEKSIRSARELLEIDKIVTAQTLRHTYAIKSLLNGEDPELLSKKLGINDPGIMDRYIEYIEQNPQISGKKKRNKR